MDLEYLDSLISSQRFHDALFYLKSVLENSSLNSDDLIFIFSKQIDFKKIIQKEYSEEQRKLIDILYSEKRYLEITKYYEENNEETFSLKECENICYAYIEIGELTSSKELISRCISYYLRENLYSRLELFLKKLNEKNINIEDESKIHCLMYLGLGKVGLAAQCDEDILIECLGEHKRKDTLLRRTELKRIWNKSEHDLEKYFSNALQLLLHNPYDKDVLKDLLERFYILQRKEGCELLTAILLNTKIVKLDHEEEAAIIQKQLDLKVFDEYEYLDEVDLGTDLFFSEDLDEVGDLENKIALLLKMNDMTAAYKWMDELRKKDPENEFLKTNEEKHFYSAGTRFLGPEKDDVGELTRLMNEFSIDGESLEEEKVYFKKTIEVIDKKKLSEIYYDLCVGLMMMELADLVIYILERIGDAEDDAENIRREYLKICAFMSLKNYSKALNQAEECLDHLPLKENERIDFYYLIGECYRKIGRKIEALKYFARVFHIDQNYRLVRQRINEKY